MSQPYRSLFHEELVLARGVFRATIPYDDIRVSARTGFGGNPYTIVTQSVEAPFDKGPPIGGGRNHYCLHVGAEGYAGMQSGAAYQGMLIHELTHVWQGCHSPWPASYIFKALANLVTKGKAAYEYSPGEPWDSYNVEQQASIVEHWFKRGQKETTKEDSLYWYVRDHIRAAKNAK